MSEEQVRPGNRDRGWNDPPEFLHTVEPTHSNPEGVLPQHRTILNQRVAHSLDATPPAEKGATFTEPPTMPLVMKPIIDELHNVASVIATPIEEAIDKIHAADISIDHIESVLTSNVALCRESDMTAKISEDITKRIKTFVSSWPKLQDAVKVRMFKLAKALETCDFHVADQIHLNLMLDYPHEVIQWMVGVKKLIHELIRIKALETPAAASEQPAPQQFDSEQASALIDTEHKEASSTIQDNATEEQ